MNKARLIITMKNLYLPLISLTMALSSCVENTETGEMEPGWLFWVFLGLIGLGLICGVIISTVRKKKPDDAPTKYEEEIEAYEETLEKKIEERNKEDKEDKE